MLAQCWAIVADIDPVLARPCMVTACYTEQGGAIVWWSWGLLGHYSSAWHVLAGPYCPQCYLSGVPAEHKWPLVKATPPYLRPVPSQSILLIKVVRLLPAPHCYQGRHSVNPYPAKFIYSNFQLLEVVDRYRDSQLQVVDNCSYLLDLRPNIYKILYLISHFLSNNSGLLG